MASGVLSSEHIAPFALEWHVAMGRDNEKKKYDRFKRKCNAAAAAVGISHGRNWNGTVESRIRLSGRTGKVKSLRDNRLSTEWLRDI